MSNTRVKWTVKKLVSSDELTDEILEFMFRPFGQGMPLLNAFYPDYHTPEGNHNARDLLAAWIDEDKKNGTREIHWYMTIESVTGKARSICQWNVHYAGKKSVKQNFDIAKKGHFKTEDDKRYAQNFSDTFLDWRFEQFEKHFDENVAALNIMVTDPDFKKMGAGTALMVAGMEDLINPLNATGVIEASPAGSILYKAFGFDVVGGTPALQLDPEWKDRPTMGAMYMYREKGECNKEQAMQAEEAKNTTSDA